MCIRDIVPDVHNAKQPNEPILIPRRLHCMDGNFSAKRLDGSGSSDLRVFRSYYFIPHADVEHFKDDVHNRSAPQTTVSCTENWTAAKAVEENKVMVFDQTGIFLVACRHGFIECVTEMARSGELYVKYFVAIFSSFNLFQTVQNMDLLPSIKCLMYVEMTKQLVTTLRVRQGKRLLLAQLDPKPRNYVYNLSSTHSMGFPTIAAVNLKTILCI